jgi:hypothetical protein
MRGRLVSAEVAYGTFLANVEPPRGITPLRLTHGVVLLLILLGTPAVQSRPACGRRSFSSVPLCSGSRIMAGLRRYCSPIGGSGRWGRSVGDALDAA